MRNYFKILRLIRRVMTPFMEIKGLGRGAGHAAAASDALRERRPRYVQAKGLEDTRRSGQQSAERSVSNLKS